MNDSILSVMVVEDDPALLNVYKMILSSQGYKVTSASNGYQAFEVLKKNAPPDIILLDYFMPRMDGRTFLLNFDASQYPHTKIVVASNLSDAKTLDEMMQLGAHSHVLKSDLSPNDLIEFVQTIHGREDN